jgi:hypothetical protein
MAATMGALGKRVFLLSSIYEDGPAVFQTRWALSYLRGPLTRAEIQRLRGTATGAGTGAGPTAGAVAGKPPSREEPGSGAGRPSGARPVLPAGLDEFFLPGPLVAAPLYRPALLGHARAHFVAARRGVDAWRELAYLAPLEPGADLDDPWNGATELPGPPALGGSAPADASFLAPSSDAFEARRLTRWNKALAEHVYRTATLTVFVAPALQETSRAGESETEFRARLALLARERRDAALEELRRRWAVKVERAQEAVRRAEERHARESSQLQNQTVQTAVNTGAAIFGALFGRRSVSSVGRAIGGASRTAKEKDDVARAAEGVAEAQRKLAELEEQVRAEIARLDTAHDPAALAIEAEPIKPRKADTATVRIALAWRAEGAEKR